MENPALPEINQKIKLSSFGRTEQILLLDDKSISFAGNALELREITHFKFGVNVLHIGMFVVGRKYQILIKTPSARLKLAFRSYFKISNSYFNHLFHQIVNGVWLRIGDRLLAEMIEAIKAGKELKFGTCTVSKTGITLNKNAKNPQKKYFISWDDLSYEKKYNRLVLNSKKDVRRWANLYYQDNYNVDVLIEFLDWIYKEDGLATLQG